MNQVPSTVGDQREEHSVLNVVLLLLISVAGGGRLAADDGLDHFLQACAHRGDNPAVIRSLSMKFECEIHDQPVNAAVEKAKRKAVHRESLLRAIEAHEPGGPQENPWMAERLKKNLENFDDWATPQIEAQFRKRLKIELLDRWLPDERRFQHRMTLLRYDAAHDRWDEPLEGIRELDSSVGGVGKYVKGMYFELSNQLAVVDRGAFTTGTRDARQFGRLEGPIADMTTAAFADNSQPGALDFGPARMQEFKRNVAHVLGINKNMRAFQVTGEESFEQSTVYVIETMREDRGVVIPMQRVKIDPNRGYICPLIEIYNQQGQVALKWESSGYFLDEESGIWFPEKYSHVAFDETGTVARRSETYQIERGSVQANRQLRDDDFAVTLPPDCTVMDVRREPRTNYKTKGVTRITLASLTDDLSSLGLIVDTTNVGLVQPVPFLPIRRTVVGWSLVAVNAFIIAAMLLLLRFRKRRDSQ